MASFTKWLFGPARQSGKKSPWTAHEVTPAEAAPLGAGDPVGVARIDFRGSGKARISYNVNGVYERTEDVDLPWMLDYPVYPEVQTVASADTGGNPTVATITMAGMLLSYKEEPNPTVTYSHWD